MNRYPIASLSSQKGIVLLEALIAVLIFSMGMLAIAGLQAAMVKNTSDAKYRSDAAYIAQQRLGVMWADPDNLLAYAEVNKDISALVPNGKRTTAFPAAGGEVTVTVTWKAPGQSQHRYVTSARVAGG